ncbi:MAG TPA: glycosyltransferase family 4 protein [Terrimicrobiaceae bacterium]
MKRRPGLLPCGLCSRVLIVSEPGADGVFRHVEALVGYLIKRGIEVDLAYSNVRDGPELYALVQRVESHCGKTLNLQTGNRPCARDGLALVELWRLALERQPEVIHAHSSKAGVLARSLRFFGIQCPIFYTPHAYFGMGNHRKSVRLFSLIERVFSRLGITIQTSKTEALFGHERIGVPKNRQVIIPNGVDCDAFQPATILRRREVRRRMNIPENAVVLGSVARYSLQKDPLTLHAAVRELLARHESIWFVHVGKGELWNDVDALGPPMPRVVRLPSFHPMSDFYQALDCFVLASRYEGLSLAVLEALATGLPLILSRVPGNWDLDFFALNGVHWTEAGNVADLARTIDDWIGIARMATNHREVALDHFQQNSCFDRIVEEYQKSLHPHRSRREELAFRP